VQPTNERAQFDLCVEVALEVVADGTLWVADYFETGARNGVVHTANAVELFVNREYSWELPSIPAAHFS
jgi:hypothetical protein